jgi:hypothetical protein
LVAAQSGDDDTVIWRLGESSRRAGKCGGHECCSQAATPPKLLPRHKGLLLTPKPPTRTLREIAPATTLDAMSADGLYDK